MGFFLGLRRFDEALEALNVGLALDPSNKVMQNMKRVVRSECKEKDAALASGLKKYFQ